MFILEVINDKSEATYILVIDTNNLYFATSLHVQKLFKFLFITTKYPFLRDVLSTNGNIFLILNTF